MGLAFSCTGSSFALLSSLTQWSHTSHWERKEDPLWAALGKSATKNITEAEVTKRGKKYLPSSAPCHYFSLTRATSQEVPWSSPLQVKLSNPLCSPAQTSAACVCVHTGHGLGWWHGEKQSNPSAPASVYYFGNTSLAAPHNTVCMKSGRNRENH